MKTILLIVIVALGISSCDVFNTDFDDIEKAILYEADSITSPPVNPTSLTIMTWNIKFGGARIDFFFDGWGNEVLMDEDVVLDNMQALADYIQLVDPDIMMLQEVDIDSKRSAYVDQVQYLLNHTNLNYGAYASQWKADFIPSDGLGRMNSGNAVLSKWEITSAKRIALPLIEEQDELTQYFYLKRNLLKTMINIEGIELPVFASHASAYDKDGTRDEQIAIIKEEVDLLDDAGSRFVLGADFNAIPPGSINYIASLFPDRPDNLPEDFELEDYDVTDLQEFYDEYYSAVPLEDYNAEEDGDYFSPYYTHSIKIIPGEIDWNRKLDYLFTNYNGWIADSDTTHQDTRELSDHCPVSAELEW